MDAKKIALICRRVMTGREYDLMMEAERKIHKTDWSLNENQIREIARAHLKPYITRYLLQMVRLYRQNGNYEDYARDMPILHPEHRRYKETPEFRT
jgi:hypothetical protein